MKKFLLTMLAIGTMTFSNAQFFENTNYVGAFGTENWTNNWANFDPINMPYATTNEVLEGEITENTSLEIGKCYLLKGFVYVKNGATLTIPAGTVIRGDKSTKGTLIVTRGSKINAQGEWNKPIIFTSNQSVGDRGYGDWGGIIILGNATMNAAGGTGTIEGGVNNSNNDGAYGGNDDADNSGVFSYVRVEFPGIPFQPDNEINGITLGGVGTGTKFDHVQVSFSGDDAIEWFGGAVNAKHLITYRSWDDDYDCDAGFHGNIQFAFTVRDPNIADKSGSNGFEIDNDGSGSTNEPRTAPTFSNVTLIGPGAIDANNVDGNYKRAVHHRRSSKLSIFNSILVGYPTGWLLDGAETYNNVNDNSSEFKNNILGCISKPWDTAGINQPTFDLGTFAKNSTNNNLEETSCDLGLTDIKLVNPNPMPLATSIVWNKAAFNSSKFGTVSVKRVNTISTSVYPNPAHYILNIEVENNLDYVATLINLQGQTIATTASNFELTNIKSGVYLLKIKTSEGTASQKVVIAK